MNYPTIEAKEYAQRVEAIRAKMHEQGIDVLVGFSNLLEIGIVRYYNIPVDGIPVDGFFAKGPGMKLINAIDKAIAGRAKVIAEDLGVVVPEVTALVKESGYPGMKVMKESTKGIEMGKVANLITDMTLIGCSDEELTRAIKHSMVVIDAPKHQLDWKRSEDENRIKELKEKYQESAQGYAAQQRQLYRQLSDGQRTDADPGWGRADGL